MNPNLSFQEKNQFMPNQPRNNDPMFENFMRSCLNNPSFFQTMKSFYDSQNNQVRTATFKPTNNQSSLSPYLSNASYNPVKNENLSNSSVQQNQFYQKSFDDPKSKRLPANPLLKYQPQPQSNVNKQPNGRRINSQENIPKSLQERPIKSQYTQTINTSFKVSMDLNSIKQNQSINIDPQDRPIKPLIKNMQEIPINSNTNTDSRQKIYRQFQQRPIKSMSRSEQQQYYLQADRKQQKTTLPQSNKSSLQTNLSNFEDRPIKGANMDFKQLIKEQFPEPFGVEKEESQERKIQPRTFLKRGSRQHLSSAATRSKQPKMDDDLNKSGISRQREITPQNRSTSQNRILGKKNTKENNDKSINKGRPKEDQPSQVVVQNAKSKPPLQISKNKKPQLKNKVAQPKPSPIASKKKKGKNVFDDNSEQSSSSDQQPFFKAASRNSQEQNMSNNEEKIEVIENVYLTNEQLEQILQKYGKSSKTQHKQSQSEKIQLIRNKYTDLCKLVESQRQAHQLQLQRQKEQFQKYKAEQMKKLKNEKKVMERQVKSGSSNTMLQKEKEQLQVLSQQLEKEREQFKKKDKNNKIIIEKYKKQNEQLKAKIQRFQMQQVSVSKKSLYSAKESIDQKMSIPRTNVTSKATRIQQEPSRQQVSYKDIKKAKDTKQATKIKYQYAQEEPIVKTKPTNIEKEQKIQNKWVSNKINDESDESQSDEEDNLKEQTKIAFEWNPSTKLSDLTKVDLSIKMVSDKMIHAMFKHQSNPEFKKYQQALQSSSRTVVNTTRNSKNSYVANLYSDRSKQLIYDNGTRKQSFENGYTIVYFKNGDIKQTLSDKTVLYYFKEKQVDQMTLPNNVNIYRFENNQVQFHFPNGQIEIRHPDGTIKVLGQHTRR